MPPADMKRPLIVDGEEAPGHPGFPVVGILGTGDFSRSLATRLVATGYQVVVGSRSPQRAVSLFPIEVEVVSQEEAASRADLVFVAVFPEHYSTLGDLQGALAGKPLVDVSNGAVGPCPGGAGGQSQAQHLAAIFPESPVVKGFNTLSAWTLQSGPRDGSRQVFLCSDSSQAKSTVAQLCRGLGFVAVDTGLLSSSLELESRPLRLFPAWRAPLLTTLALFLFFYLYNFLRDVLQPFVSEGRSHFYQMPLETVNDTLPAVALAALALVYLPGLLAAGVQLRRGTKYRHFPGWLDRWLGRRKQLGLCSFCCAALHATYSLSLPLRRSARYKLLNAAYKQVQQRVEDSWVEAEVWRMELYLCVGVLALGVMVLLAIASLPSVATSLTWREFSFIQSTLGYGALSLATLHALLYGWDHVGDAAQYRFLLPPTFCVAAAPACVVLLGRGALLLPCLARRLWLIRRGWERTGRHARFALGQQGGDHDTHV